MPKIVSFNIEGIKGNTPYLKELQSDSNIICLQEHWLHGYETNILQKIAPDHDYHIPCFDDNNIDIENHNRRGNGETHQVLLINNHMPTMMTGSEPQYREHLDKISSIIDKYDNTHSIIVTGDLNGSLISIRNNNHDKLLKEFCRKHHLNHTFENTQDSTFYHHNGKSCSQIDYILENKDTDILRSTTIEDQYHTNGSAHVPIRAKTNMSIASDKIKGKKSKPKTILKWEETNIGSYQEAIETLQEQSNIPDSIADIEEQYLTIIDILSKASNTNVKKKIVSLKGPNWKASEKVKELISKSKNAFYSWKQNGRPKEQDKSIHGNEKLQKRSKKTSPPRRSSG
ncbi:unnamed protein product [Mytilus coruscus]|uniref:Endonuclease/exonuclease/phosphatase domain-containing protein n=1 Tax=Mytilus coruscus TaxID=42192 RepID=A0A6J8C9I5_MYTCO|nr:unnamed protein product [Mytilus coruscus]